MSFNGDDIALVESAVTKSANQQIDEMECAMLDNLSLIDCPLKHRFTKGLYTREIFMPAGSYITSMVHNTEHPFMILKGKVSVFSENDDLQVLEAPYVGITKPKTRRVLYIHEDTVWVTTHVTDIKPESDTEESVNEALKKIGDEILEPYVNPLIGYRIQNNRMVACVESGSPIKSIEKS